MFHSVFTVSVKLLQLHPRQSEVFDAIAPAGRNVGSFRHSEMLVAPEGRSVKSYIFMEHRSHESDGFSQIFSLIAGAKLILQTGKRIRSYTVFHSV